VCWRKKLFFFSPFFWSEVSCQVVFSRAVIALGSDWGKELTGALSPFEFVGLRASVPGKLRWVTTSIARFDPTNEWPTDLDFSVSVKNITTFDGSKLTNSASVSYSTKPLAMRVRGVSSALAASLTGGQWSAATWRLDGRRS
jgi:hypothetical protein